MSINHLTRSTEPLCVSIITFCSAFVSMWNVSLVPRLSSPPPLLWKQMWKCNFILSVFIFTVRQMICPYREGGRIYRAVTMSCDVSSFVIGDFSMTNWYMLLSFPSRIDHWDLEKERLLVLTDKFLISVKFNFRASIVEELKYIPIKHVVDLLYGDFKYTSSIGLWVPGGSLSIHIT